MSGMTLRVENLQTKQSEAHEFNTSSVRIGRHPLNELQLDFQFVSQWHGVVRFDGAAYHYLDLGSTNGSYLNNRRLNTGEEMPVGPSDELRIGWLRLIPEQENVSQEQPIPPPITTRGRGTRTGGTRGGRGGRSTVQPVGSQTIIPEVPDHVRGGRTPRPVSPSYREEPRPQQVRGSSGDSELLMVLWRVIQTLSPQTQDPRDPGEWEQLIDRLGRATELLGELVVEQADHDDRLGNAVRLVCPDERAEPHEKLQALLGYLLDVQAPPGARVGDIKQALE